MQDKTPASVFPLSRSTWLWLAGFFGVLLWSAVHPKDYFTWFLEVAPGLIAFAVLALTYPRFRFTPFVSALILIHIWILCVGGHYTYAEVPLFEYFKTLFHWTRNDYDKLGHLAQGFVPALVIRELVLRHRVIARRGWTFPLVTLTCLGISAAYELFEWLMAVTQGGAADAFLGTQGDVWDTQSDMFCALIGAVTAQLLLGRWRDRVIARMQKK